MTVKDAEFQVVRLSHRNVVTDQQTTEAGLVADDLDAWIALVILGKRLNEIETEAANGGGEGTPTHGHHRDVTT